MRPTTGLQAGLFLVGLLVASALSAQFGQYTSPGASTALSGVEETSGSSVDRDVIDEILAESRWRLGPVRLRPFLGVRQAAAYSNVFGTANNQVSDASVTAGAGLTAYLPTGSDVLWTLELQPEYVLWVDQTERNHLAGRYGLGVAALFNRLQLTLFGARFEEQRLVTPEVVQPVDEQRDRLDGSLTLELSPAWGLFLSAGRTEVATRSELAGDPRVPDFSRLDRTEERERAGVVWKLPNEISVRLLYEVSSYTFAPDARPLSVDGEGPVLQLHGQGNRLGFDVELSDLRVRPQSTGSRSPPRDEVGGRAELRLDVTSRVGLGLRVERSQLFALDDAYSNFTYQRVGMDWRIDLGRWGLRFFGGYGTDDYRAIEQVAPGRVDTETSYGLRLRIPLPRALSEGLRLDAGWTETRINSDIEGLDRTIGGPLLGLAYSFGNGLRWQ